MIRRSINGHQRPGAEAPHLETLFHYYAYGKPQVGLDHSDAAGGPVPSAEVIILPSNGREVEVDDEGRVIGS